MRPCGCRGKPQPELTLREQVAEAVFQGWPESECKILLRDAEAGQALRRWLDSLPASVEAFARKTAAEAAEEAIAQAQEQGLEDADSIDVVKAAATEDYVLLAALPALSAPPPEETR